MPLEYLGIQEISEQVVRLNETWVYLNSNIWEIKHLRNKAD